MNELFLEFRRADFELLGVALGLGSQPRGSERDASQSYLAQSAERSGVVRWQRAGQQGSRGDALNLSPASSLFALAALLQGALFRLPSLRFLRHDLLVREALHVAHRTAQLPHLARLVKQRLMRRANLAGQQDWCYTSWVPCVSIRRACCDQGRWS